MAWYTQTTRRLGEVVSEGRLNRFTNRQAAREHATFLVTHRRGKGLESVKIFSGKNQSNLKARERYWFDGELQRIEY